MLPRLIFLYCKYFRRTILQGHALHRLKEELSMVIELVEERKKERNGKEESRVERLPSK